MKNIEEANKKFDEGYALETGNGIKQDYDKAIEKYLEAEKYGNYDATCRAGYIYQFVKGNIKKAVELYEKAVNNNSANGKFLLGNCYYEGIGVEKNILKGCELRNEALRDGSALAQAWFAKLTNQFSK